MNETYTSPQLAVADSKGTACSTIGRALSVTGITVKREEFLSKQFSEYEPVLLSRIKDVGPVQAGCSRDELRKKADVLIRKAAWETSVASFSAGISSGKEDKQLPKAYYYFYSYRQIIRLAQELAYLYGVHDIWETSYQFGLAAEDRLILYLGVMLCCTGASSAVRISSELFAASSLKRIPQKALTKTFYYPVIKSISRKLGCNMNKDIFAKGVSDAIVITGSATSALFSFFSLKDQAKRLADTFDEACFAYLDEKLEEDLATIEKINTEESLDINSPDSSGESIKSDGDIPADFDVDLSSS